MDIVVPDDSVLVDPTKSEQTVTVPANDSVTQEYEIDKKPGTVVVVVKDKHQLLL